MTDLHIDFAQELLRKEFPNIHGLRSVHLLSSKIPKLSNGSVFLQILHSRGNHWIVVSAVGVTGSVRVYDSLYKSIDEGTRNVCVKLFGAERCIESGTCTQQQGSTDCGVHAIATCTALAHGRVPTYSRAGIREHLISCFEAMSITPF